MPAGVEVQAATTPILQTTYAIIGLMDCKIIPQLKPIATSHPHPTSVEVPRTSCLVHRSV